MFEIVLPAAVEAEILSPDPHYPSRVYPDSALFEAMVPNFVRPSGPVPPRLRQFGPGESEAIPWAAQLDCPALINDRRPYEHARALQIAAISVPGMIVIARSQEFIPDHVARAILAQAAFHGTSPRLIQEANELLDDLLR